MKKLLNTLFVTSEDAYITLDGENVVVNRDKQEIARFPLHTLSGILCFSYAGASPALMGYCAHQKMLLSFCSPRGRFLARVVGETSGNVLLRRTQYRVADDPAQSVRIARLMIFGKLYNTRQYVERVCRDHSLRVNLPQLKEASRRLKELLPTVCTATDIDSLRGWEGVGANAYFDVLDEMILNRKDVFSFTARNRRPPRDPVNALLSFAYSLLANDCASALEAVGLDAFVGFMHQDRPGRRSLAADLMEELRPCMADRFVLSCINNRMFDKSDFQTADSGAVQLTDAARKTFLKNWQERKTDTITHPFLGEKVQWGMVPYVQALLLARYLRGDIDEYPPFLWK
ncbi:MAG: type I-C CRISPR-associated endonuclease Cas1 [Oscillospiraceae bacterium]|nr:type I-C CRISPR-associated endonuclease Cas1 [Oscillospiraceae bacterium]